MNFKIGDKVKCIKSFTLPISNNLVDSYYSEGYISTVKKSPYVRDILIIEYPTDPNYGISLENKWKEYLINFEIYKEQKTHLPDFL